MISVTSKAYRCEGFTRPLCEPCKSTEGVQQVKYDSLGTIEKKHLCAKCRSRLLPEHSKAWEND